MAAYLLNPDLPLPGGLEPLIGTGRVRFTDDVEIPSGAVLHLPSTIELAIPLDRLFPTAARSTPLSLVVTLFDLVQEAMPEEYLADPGVRRRYRSRLELVRQADALISISAHTGREAARLLDIPERRITAVPLVASAAYRPPSSRRAAVERAKVPVPALRDDYVLYTAGSDGRKNVERLIEAWAQLPARVRTKWQLVLACHLPPLRRNHFEVLADRLGLGDGFLCTGFVDESTLVHLNQGAGLAVMPSLDEGFGFPVAEALASGTPAIGSDRTSIPELLPPSALFDPTDVRAIATAIDRALTDERHRRELLAWADRPVRTWGDVATETLAVYDAVAARANVARRVRPTSRPHRMAFVTPLPPQPGGVGDYSFRLLEELRDIDGLSVEVFVDGPPHERTAMLAAEAPHGIGARPLAVLDRVEALEGRHDSVVYSVGNSEFHTGALHRLLRRGGGIVLAHDVRLTNLYRFAAWQHPAATPGGFHATLQRMYGGRLPSELAVDGHLSPDDADRWGVFMARDVIARSTRYLATSAFAAELARLDARPEDRSRIEVLPFSVGAVPLRDPTPAGRRPAPAVVASFGVVNALKQGVTVIDAFVAARHRSGHEDARLVFVGPAGAADTESILGRAQELGITSSVELTGEVDEATYRTWLDRAWVAVQLRSVTNGESSGAIGDCLTAGIPTIATAIGPNRSLPEHAARTVAVGADSDVVAEVLAALLASPEQRSRLGDGALAYAADHSFARAAAALYDVVCSVSVEPA